VRNQPQAYRLRKRVYGGRSLQTQQKPTPEALRKLDALRRAIPVTRMTDYGVPLADALEVHAQTASGHPPEWEDICERLSHEHARMAVRAQQAGEAAMASSSWRASAALLQCAQLAFNADEPVKLALYEASQEALLQHARLEGDLDALTVATPQGNVHGWLVRPRASPVRGVVLVLGGLSGWGAAYLDMGRSLAARGLLAILGEGPGQGLTRMRSAITLRAETLPLFRAFLDAVPEASTGRFGVWGNSFGGLFAAHVAAADPRVCAVCINGAPMTPQTPSFRTALEQMFPVFGVSGETALSAHLDALAMTPRRHHVSGDILILEGGRDPLVPLGEQASFAALASPGRARTISWEDGEHTIYNHAQERNARVADWFAERLDGPEG
jgi:dienelactone hydrolase